MKNFVKTWLDEQGTEVERMDGLNGEYGLLFSFLEGDSLKTVELSNDMDVIFTAWTLSTSQKATSSLTLTEAVHTGVLISLQELCWTLSSSSEVVMGELGEQWANVYSDVIRLKGSGTRVCMSEFALIPPPTLH